MPKVSIVVPVYNVEHYIYRCLDSIQKQTMSDIEIIVVNDATPDNSMIIVEELASVDKRIMILNHEENSGLMYARRTGYMSASSKYVMFCDSDDYLPDNAVNALFEAAEETQADIVSGNTMYISIEGKQIPRLENLRYGGDRIGVLQALLRKEYPHNLWGKMYKASLLQEFPYQTLKHFTNGEDAYLFYQVIENTDKVVHLNSYVYYYVQNKESSTNVRFNDNAIKCICQVGKLREETVSKYPCLYRDLFRYNHLILKSLFIEGYDKDTNLSSYISQYDLGDYLSIRSSLKYFSILELMKWWVRFQHKKTAL